jgi:hypothetical protein
LSVGHFARSQNLVEAVFFVAEGESDHGQDQESFVVAEVCVGAWFVEAFDRETFDSQAINVAPFVVEARIDQHRDRQAIRASPRRWHVQRE